jgi:hypothetical protein
MWVYFGALRLATVSELRIAVAHEGDENCGACRKCGLQNLTLAVQIGSLGEIGNRFGDISSSLEPIVFLLGSELDAGPYQYPGEKQQRTQTRIDAPFFGTSQQRNPNDGKGVNDQSQ